MWSQLFCEFMVSFGCEEIHIVPVGDDKADYLVTENSFNDALNKLGVHLLGDHSKYLGEYDKRSRLLISSSRHLSLAVKLLPRFLIKYFYKDFFAKSQDFQMYVMFPHYSERVLEPKIKLKFGKEFDLITSTPRPFEYMKLNKDFFNLPIKKIAKKYGFLSIYSLTEKPFDESYFIGFKQKIRKEEADGIFKNIADNNRRFEKFLNKLSDEDRKLCEVLRNFVFIRTDRMDVWRRSSLIVYPFIEYLAKMVSKDFGIREGSMLLHKEVLGLLSGKMPVVASDLEKRGKRREIVLSYTKSGSYVTYGMEEIDRINKEMADNGSPREIVGVIAQNGFAKGKVRLYTQGLSKWKSDEGGFVFVARHTMPQDLPYMKNAIAIVTDEGGITSHTAIVARELNIPTVIGTKLATKVLHDGDLVEVDAGKGIVKILKKTDE